MTALPARHHWIAAPSREEREQLAAGLDLPPIIARVDAHRRLRGPYTAAGSLVRALVPDALARHPDLVSRHDVEVLTVAPELAGSVPCERETLTSLSPPEERTRYYPRSRTRRIAHGLVEMLRDVVAASFDGPRTVVLDRVDDTEPTDREWLAILLRRVDPARLRVVLCTRGELPDSELATALGRYATRLASLDSRGRPTRNRPDEAPVVESAAVPAGDGPVLAARYVTSDCTSDDPALQAAYRALAPKQRARLHDTRADELAARGEVTLGLGAVPFHRERGSDPEGAGAETLLAALQHCMLMGFHEAVIDLGRRCQAILHWDTRPEDCWRVTAKLAMALAVLGRPDEAAALYDDACAQTTLPTVHLRAAYGRAMLYTRYYEPDRRDLAEAKRWINAAVDLADQSPDRRQHAFNVTFTHNALALLEMRMGDPRTALELVTRSLQRLDEEIEDHRQLLHRSVLRYNRAQLLERLGTLTEALAEYSKVIAEDPHHSEYYLHRAAVLWRLGRNADALADCERAMRASPPYPEPYYARAKLALEAGDAGGALADLDYVLDLDPELSDARVDRANVRLELGDLDGSQKDADAGLAIDPEHAELHALRGTIAHQLGRREEAHRSFAAALRFDPTLAPALSNRATLWFEQGEIDRAIEDLTHALEIEDDPDIRANRALAYEAAGQSQLAASDRAHAAARAARLAAERDSMAPAA